MRDIGVGIPPEEVPPKSSSGFIGSGNRRLHRTRAPGIGPALVQELVRLHSGSTIRLESKLDAGSRFIGCRCPKAHLDGAPHSRLAGARDPAISAAQAFVKKERDAVDAGGDPPLEQLWAWRATLPSKRRGLRMARR